MITSAVLTGCTTTNIPTAPGQSSTISSTPLPEGVYSGTVVQNVITTSPTGEQATQELSGAVSYEITENGMPIVQGKEISVGRTVEMEGLQVKYTRIQVTETGIIIHSEINGKTNGVTFSGSAIATLAENSDGSLQYSFTQTVIDSAGFSLNYSGDTRLTT